ncbi:MAG: adenosine kinase, partial [Gammaproteobacteria bacterium]|nr:adenosine kinase [Gammaproteobacteria bacterium]
MTGGGARFDVLGIGNAIVDTLAGADEEFLKQRGLRKGAMNLADAATSDALAALVKPLRECSGGSVANTIAALASFGSRCAYIGKVRDDRLGAVFRDDMRALGVTFDTPPSPAAAAAATARCIVLVTPDARRTLQTYLGACVELSADDVDESTVRDSRVVYLEGYLWDPPAARQAFVKTAA